jgi:hypothetical protein
VEETTVTTTVTTTDRSAWCSVVTREAEVDPVGTAGSYAGFVLVEWPAPWPKDVSGVEALTDVVAELAVGGVRVQLVRAAEAPGRSRRITSYRRPAGEWFAGYERAEVQVDVDDVVPTLRAIGERPHARDADVLDVLVCTHGTRDVCCGSLGTTFAARLEQLDLGGPSTTVRVWRTSHLGGHRFAPTALVLPDGTMWAHLDEVLARNIVERRGDVPWALASYRGSCGMPSREAQAVERLAFAETGWGWLERPRQALGTADGQWRVESAADDRTLTWTCTVRQGRQLPVPVCRQPIEQATKYEAELRVDLVSRGEGVLASEGP